MPLQNPAAPHNDIWIRRTRNRSKTDRDHPHGIKTPPQAPPSIDLIVWYWPSCWCLYRYKPTIAEYCRRLTTKKRAGFIIGGRIWCKVIGQFVDNWSVKWTDLARVGVTVIENFFYWHTRAHAHMTRVYNW